MKTCTTLLIVAALSLFILTAPVAASDDSKKPEVDVIKTETGDLTITFIGHGTVILRHSGKTIHVDPYGRLADYSKLPKADLILITHEHGDHLDAKAVAQIKKPSTKIVLTKACVKTLPEGQVIGNGQTVTVDGFKIEAVPAYNIVHKRPGGDAFHPKGSGNGYVITFAKTRLYIAGDTENIPEMANLKKIDIAFLPMNLPYTMTPEMVADAARTIKPKILYPYHYGRTDPTKLVELLKNDKDIEVRIRKMQ